MSQPKPSHHPAGDDEDQHSDGDGDHRAAGRRGVPDVPHGQHRRDQSGAAGTRGPEQRGQRVEAGDQHGAHRRDTRQRPGTTARARPRRAASCQKLSRNSGSAEASTTPRTPRTGAATRGNTRGLVRSRSSMGPSVERVRRSRASSARTRDRGVAGSVAGRRALGPSRRIRDDPGRRKSPARQHRTHEQDHHDDTLRPFLPRQRPTHVEERSTGSRVLRIAAGAALVAGPVLWAAGMWTSPPWRPGPPTSTTSPRSAATAP